MCAQAKRGRPLPSKMGGRDGGFVMEGSYCQNNHEYLSNKKLTIMNMIRRRGARPSSGQREYKRIWVGVAIARGLQRMSTR